MREKESRQSVSVVGEAFRKFIQFQFQDIDRITKIKINAFQTKCNRYAIRTGQDRITSYTGNHVFQKDFTGNT